MKLLPISVKTMAKPVADEAAEMLLGDRELMEGMGLGITYVGLPLPLGLLKT